MYNQKPKHSIVFCKNCQCASDVDLGNQETEMLSDGKLYTVCPNCSNLAEVVAEK